MLPVKKLYIDSKARTADSRSTSNFSLDLTESLTMPEGAVFQVCDVLIPHSWYLIDDSNRNLYFFELDGLSGSGFFTIALNIGNYLGPDLAGEIGRALHAQATKFFLIMFLMMTQQEKYTYQPLHKVTLAYILGKY